MSPLLPFFFGMLSDDTPYFMHENALYIRSNLSSVVSDASKKTTWCSDTKKKLVLYIDMNVIRCIISYSYTVHMVKSGFTDIVPR